MGEDEGNGEAAGRGEVGGAEVVVGVGRGGCGAVTAGRCIGCVDGAVGGATTGVTAVVGLAVVLAFLATLRLATFLAGLRADAAFLADFFAARFAGRATFFFLRSPADLDAALIFFLGFLDVFAFFAMIVLPIVKGWIIR
jgi:hypothetical protein